MTCRTGVSNRASMYGKVKAAIFAGFALGLTVNETAERFGVNRRSVRSSAGSYGVKLRSLRRPRGSLKAAVCLGYEAGQSCREICDATGYTAYSVYKAARRLSITLKPSATSLPCTPRQEDQGKGKARSAKPQASPNG